MYGNPDGEVFCDFPFSFEEIADRRTYYKLYRELSKKTEKTVRFLTIFFCKSTAWHPEGEVFVIFSFLLLYGFLQGKKKAEF